MRPFQAKRIYDASRPQTEMLLLTKKFPWNRIAARIPQTPDEFRVAVRAETSTTSPEKSFTQRELAYLLSMSFTGDSRVENEMLHFGDCPSPKVILTLAELFNALDGELLPLADKVLESVCQRIRERSDVFRAVAQVVDNAMGQRLDRMADNQEQMADNPEQAVRAA